jgi:hypothetical protein
MIEVLCDEAVDNGLSKICYKMKDAEAEAFAMSTTSSDVRIWALDVARRDGTIGKCFYAATVLGLYTHFLKDKCKNYRWYEVISAAHPVKFHLDVEVECIDASRYGNEELACAARQRLVDMGIVDEQLDELFLYCCTVSAEEWCEEECAYATTFVRKALVAFFSRNFEHLRKADGNAIEPVILSGCRPSKFSLHIIVNELILDRAFISCRYLGWEFARALWQFIEIGFNEFVIEGKGTGKCY